MESSRIFAVFRNVRIGREIQKRGGEKRLPQGVGEDGRMEEPPAAFVLSCLALAQAESNRLP
jgi:hypothetical protein